MGQIADALFDTLDGVGANELGGTHPLVVLCAILGVRWREYALSGGIECVHCGAHYVGTAATGRTKRYRYYTCYTRARYGPDSCPAERLPADEVEEKMTAALLDTYQQTGLIQEAISIIAAEIAEIGSKRDKELATIDANLTEVTAKIDRYRQAFEKGTMSDTAASERVSLLKEHQQELRAHRNQLDAEPAPEPANEVTADDLASMREEIKDLVTNGAHGVKNALFRALVDEIQVTGHHKIKPYFRVPLDDGTRGAGPGVRIMTGWAPPARQNTNRFPVIEGPTITLTPPGTRRRRGSS